MFSLFNKLDAVSQKISAQSQAFNSFATYDLHKIAGDMKLMTKKDFRQTIGICDQRRNRRIKKNFQVTLHKRVSGSPDVLLEGNTSDLTQGDAFIKTEGWHSFQPGELAELTFFFPPDFTGKDAPIGLQGSAIVIRVDPLREGIAVKFIHELRQFRPTTAC